MEWLHFKGQFLLDFSNNGLAPSLIVLAFSTGKFPFSPVRFVPSSPRDKVSINPSQSGGYHVHRLFRIRTQEVSGASVNEGFSLVEGHVLLTG